MAKDTYYFSHDYNARNDRKTAALIKDYKAMGYGIFWATCELLHEESNELEFDDLTIELIAKDLNESIEIVTEVIEKCVNKYKLFSIHEAKGEANEAEIEANEAKKVLRSNRVHRNLSTKTEKKNSKAEAGRIGGLISGSTRRAKSEYVEPTIEADEAKNEAGILLPEANEASNQINERKDIESIQLVNTVIVVDSIVDMTSDKFYEFKEKLKTDTLFVEQILMSKGMKSVNDLEGWISHFNVHIVVEDKIKKDYREYRKHFKNWLNKQDTTKKINGNGIEHNKSGTKTSRGQALAGY